MFLRQTISCLTDQGCQFVFFKPEFETLAFQHLWLFWKSKTQKKNWIFLAFFGRKGLSLAKHCLSCIIITNLF